MDLVYQKKSKSDHSSLERGPTSPSDGTAAISTWNGGPQLGTLGLPDRNDLRLIVTRLSRLFRVQSDALLGVLGSVEHLHREGASGQA